MTPDSKTGGGAPHEESPYEAADHCNHDWCRGPREVAALLAGRPWTGNGRHRPQGVRLRSRCLHRPSIGLALWPRTRIAHDSGLTPGTPTPTEFTLGHNVSSEAEVDAVIKQARNAGAVVVKPAADTFWGGYAGYFSGPRRRSLGGCVESAVARTGLRHQWPRVGRRT